MHVFMRRGHGAHRHSQTGEERGRRAPPPIRGHSTCASSRSSSSPALPGGPGSTRRTRSACAERILGGSYADFVPDRSALQRYGLNVGDAQRVVETAIGGMEISQTVQGRERYSINVRYPRELRDDVAVWAGVPVLYLLHARRAVLGRMATGCAGSRAA